MSLRIEAFKSLIAPLLQAGKSQNAVAKELGIEPSTFSRWLNTGRADYVQVAMVAERLGVDAGLIWGGKVPRRFVAGQHQVSVPRGTSTNADASEDDRRPQPVVPAAGPVVYLSPPPTVLDVDTALWQIESFNATIAVLARQLREQRVTAAVPTPDRIADVGEAAHEPTAPEPAGHRVRRQA